jgi:hypothetical protein
MHLPVADASNYPFYNTSQKNVAPKMTQEPHAFFAGKVLALSALCSYSPALTL